MTPPPLGRALETLASAKLGAALKGIIAPAAAAPAEPSRNERRPTRPFDGGVSIVVVFIIGFSSLV
ncbi:hypothetical protein [Corynebacterium casei]|uniref:hypothetical protein n=1 Tax=Corynebacterium casei TaxID=160386 RepID=UPI0004B2254A|nr:hypothetical protein [Corynebacterium casei]